MTEAAVLRLIVSLLFIVALILVCAWLTRRTGWLRAGSSQTIKLLGSQSLGARTFVALVEVDNTRLVLGVTAQQISLLHTLPLSPQPAQEDSAQPCPEPVLSFASSLRQVLSKRRA